MDSLNYQLDEDCEMQAALEGLGTAELAIGYTIVALGVSGLVDPLVGLQAMGFLQIAYFTLGSHYHQVHPYL